MRGAAEGRGLAATVKDWLLSAEYILSQGNRNVILCERGIKTFEDSVCYTLDITSIPVLQQWSHLPVVVDPSHCCGKDAMGPPPWPPPALPPEGTAPSSKYTIARRRCCATVRRHCFLKSSMS